MATPNLNLIESPPHADSGVAIRATSKGMRELLERAHAMARMGDPVLIEGETGTGKSLLAHFIHLHSRRRQGAFERRSCGAFDHGSLTSILFGHSKGAFTGAEIPVTGLFAQAHGGTVVLDDIDYLSMEQQPRLLRLLDDGTFFRLGEHQKPVTVDVRILATTNKNLQRLVQQGRFYDDLFQRLYWRLRIPPLRDRPEDIRDLASYFLTCFQEEELKEGVERAQGEPWHFSVEALEQLTAYHWPGNIRELKGAVRNIAMFCPGDRRPILPDHVLMIQSDPQLGIMPRTSGRIVDGDGEELERIQRMLIVTSWNVSEVSRVTGRSRTTIYKLIEKYGWRRPVLPS